MRLRENSAHFSDEARQVQIQQLLRVIALRLALPIYVGFWPLEVLYLPDRKWEFLAIRLVAIPLTLGTARLMKRGLPSLAAAEAACVIFFGTCGAMTSAMASFSGGVESPYFGGLGLVALSSIPFLPIRQRALAATIIAIYSPFVILGGLSVWEGKGTTAFAVHAAVMFCTMVISMVLRRITGRIRANERIAEQKLGRVARQVAHDIRSPIYALKVAVATLADVPEKNRVLIRSALSRIEGIADDLLGKHGGTPASSDEAIQWIEPMVESLCLEKRLQYSARPDVSMEVEATGFTTFAKLSAKEFKRVLSNLINNAVESGEGRVHVALIVASEAGRVRVAVRDNGRGMTPELVARMRRAPASVGKSGGHGLGLLHAMEFAGASGGNFLLESEPGKGTTATIELPASPPPDWIAVSLAVGPSRKVVVVDDEPFLHDLWDNRWEALGAGVKCTHLHSVAELRAWAPPSASPLYLVDYDFRTGAETGLQAIADLRLAPHAVLVTNRYEEELIRERCRSLGLRLLPKRLAHLVPLSLG